MKRILSIFLSFSLILCVTSCSVKQANNESKSTSGSEIQIISFKSADIRMADDFSEIICIDKGTANHLIFGKLKSGEYSGYVANAEFTEKKSYIFTPQDNEIVRTAALVRFGKSAVLTTIGNDTVIYTYDSNCNLENKFVLGEVIASEDNYVEMLCAEDGFYINVARHTLVFVDNEGNNKGVINTNGRTICGVTFDDSGVPCILMSDGDKMTLATLSDGKTVEEIDCEELADYINAISRGEGEYRLAVIVTDGLYGFKEDKWVKLSDFSDNDFSINDILDISMTGEGEFAVLIRNNDDNCEMRLLSQRDISEIKQKKIIRMANTMGGNIDSYSSQMKKYNSENDEYKIEIVDYSGDGITPAFDRMKLDILSGDAPDIVQFSAEMPITAFGSVDSIFVDFYKLMDSESDITRDNFIDGFLESQETNGKLLQLYPSFNIQSLIIKDKFANGLTSWNYEQFESAYLNIPYNMEFAYNSKYSTKYSMFKELIDYRHFIDTANAECSFDSPEFIKAIRLINDNNIGLSVLAADSATDMIGSVDDVILDFRNDKVLVEYASISNFRDIKLYEQVYSGEPCTFIGYPSENGINAYAYILDGYGIMANSDVIDGAWDFLKYYLFNDESNNQGLSGLKSKFESQLEYECTLHTEIDADTNEEFNIERYAVFESGKNEPTVFELQPFTTEQTEKYISMIYTALQHPLSTDNNIESILQEELTAYFEGEKSAEDTAKIIQDRVSIYISERS